MERKIKRKDFKKKIEWLLDNKDKISRCRRNFYMDALGERYGDFIPYEKYGRYGGGIREYLSDLYSARLRKQNR